MYQDFSSLQQFRQDGRKS